MFFLYHISISQTAIFLFDINYIFIIYQSIYLSVYLSSVYLTYLDSGLCLCFLYKGSACIIFFLFHFLFYDHTFVYFIFPFRFPPSFSARKKLFVVLFCVNEIDINIFYLSFFCSGLCFGFGFFSVIAHCSLFSISLLSILIFLACLL